MKKNLGNEDKIIRLGMVAVLVVSYLSGTIIGTVGITGLVVSAVLALTSFMGICPLYSPLGIIACQRTTTK